MVELVTGIVLGIGAYEDCKNREIHIIGSIVLILLGMYLRMARLSSGEIIKDIIYSLVPGLVIIAVSRATHMIGIGDGIMIMGIGSCMGTMMTLKIIIRSIFMAGGIGIIVWGLSLFRNRTGHEAQYEIPLVTLFFISYIWEMIALL